MLTKEIDIEALIVAMQAKAEQKRLDAGMSGSWGDGGARALEDQIEAFKCGMTGQIPNDWIEAANQMKVEADPEYDEYLRMKKKFEGK